MTKVNNLIIFWCAALVVAALMFPSISLGESGISANEGEPEPATAGAPDTDNMENASQTTIADEQTPPKYLAQMGQLEELGMPEGNQPEDEDSDVPEPEEETAQEDEEAQNGTLPSPPTKMKVLTEKPVPGMLEGVGGKVYEEPPKGKQLPEELRESAEAADSSEATGEAREGVTAGEGLSDVVMQEMSILNVPTGNLRTFKPIMDENYNFRGVVYGEEFGFIKILEGDNNLNLREVWKSPPVNAPVRGVFVMDVDKDGVTEIIAYTNDGNIFIYNFQERVLKYRTPEGTYDGVGCMVITNLDSDEPLELLFIDAQPGNPGNLVQIDSQSYFEEWRSSEEYSATDMIVGNVDNDDDLEIIMSTGEVLSGSFKSLEWQSDTAFGERLYLLDVDSDGKLELITEYGQEYIRIFDIDERREKW
jgi:hypothetical protein